MYAGMDAFSGRLKETLELGAAPEAIRSHRQISSAASSVTKIPRQVQNTLSRSASVSARSKISSQFSNAYYSSLPATRFPASPIALLSSWTAQAGLLIASPYPCWILRGVRIRE